jgi:hypothetical protein
MRHTAAFVGGALLAIATCIVGDAVACGFVDYRAPQPVERKPPPKPVPASDRVAAADQRLEEEHFAEAAGQVTKAFPRILAVHVGASPLETHAQRILALAIVRSDGKLAGVAGLRGASLEWAVDTLRAVSVARRDDPVAQADLGEALAASPRTEGDALPLLADLASRDLLGSAHAYAALARLQTKGGDTEKAHAALERCALMTKSPALVCRVPDNRVAAR